MRNLTLPAARLVIMILCCGAIVLSMRSEGAAEDVPWTFSAPSGVVFAPLERVPITVRVGKLPATGVRIWHSDVVDASTKNPLFDGLICSDAIGSCEREVSLTTPLLAKTMYLETTGRPGQYSGTLIISSNETPAGTSVGSLTIYVSDELHKWLGVVAIAGGTFVSWLITVVLRNAIARDQMRLPAAYLRQRLSDLKKTLGAIASGNVAVDAPATTRKIDEVTASLSESMLKENGLISIIQPPWAAPAAIAGLSNYQSYLQSASDWASDLQIIVDGFQQAVSTQSAPSAAIAACVAKIDGLSIGKVPPTSAAVASSVQAALSTLRAAAPAATPGPGGGPQPGSPSAANLEIQITRLTVAAWTVVILVTCLVGSYVLIFSSNGLGFGTTVDYLNCFLWGLGFSSGTTLLQGTTTQTVRTALGVTSA